MRQVLLGVVWAALAVAGLGLWLRAGAPLAGASAPPAPAAPAAPAAEAALAPEPAGPRVDAPPPPAAAAPETAGADGSAASAPVPAAPTPPPRRLGAAPGAKRVAPVRPRVSVEPTEDPYPALDQLLELPPPPAEPPGPQSVDWAGAAEDEPAGPGEARRERRVRLDYSRESLVEGVPMQSDRRRTDLGVSVRVDEADRLRLRGGVRVDERELSEEEKEAERTPTVGVEVRF